ncbi:MAG TPA: polysaccharide deacetylase family protein [Bacteroidales bacterium]|nr:polysaccharide deacetylase family protein [Bacteroidales bacterium]
MNILTFDVEDWFHILDNDSTRTEYEWNRYESRIMPGIERIFRILKEHNTRATFFCLGWIARKHPEIVKKIDNEGYEIACHSSMHQLVYQQTPDEFRYDLKESISILEDITGKKVRSYRAPGFSITEKCKWAFEILLEAGIENDSSVFPAERIHGGFPSYKANHPSLIKINNGTLREFPVNIKQVMGKKFVFSGGGYFRLFPYSFIKSWTAESNYVMSYLHPRDFDYEQPVIKNLPVTRKFRSYVGLKHSERKLSRWLDDFMFTDLQTAIKDINWSNIQVISL